MAPVCVARRLTLPAVLMFMLILTIVPSNINSLLRYDRQVLLRIKLSLVKFDLNGHKTPPPPLLSDVPAHLLRAEVSLPCRRRCRRRGKRGGSLVKIKTYLALRENRLHCYHPSQHDATCHRLFTWRVPVPAGTWLVPVVCADEELYTRPRFPRLRRGGVDHRHLRPLARATRTADVPAPIRYALVNR